MVPPRFELGTHGFSVRCSTNWAKVPFTSFQKRCKDRSIFKLSKSFSELISKICQLFVRECACYFRSLWLSYGFDVKCSFRRFSFLVDMVDYLWFIAWIGDDYSWNPKTSKWKSEHLRWFNFNQPKACFIIKRVYYGQKTCFIRLPLIWNLRPFVWKNC